MARVTPPLRERCPGRKVSAGGGGGVDYVGAAELGVVEGGVGAVGGDELVVAALLDDAPVLHHQDEIGIADGGEAMGDHEARPVGAEGGGLEPRVRRFAPEAEGYRPAMATKFGLTLSSEEHSPPRLVELATLAEEHGFDFVSISDHFHPWITSQGHSPFVWSVLGAIAQATEEIEVAVGVTCPTMRIHPAVLAQATATTANLLPNRFTWGVGSGEALNEQILGDAWPPADIRLEMLEEAVDVIRQLWSGESTTFRGDYYIVEDATIFDPPPGSIPIVISAFGPAAVEVAARIGDGLWTTGTKGEIVDEFKEQGGTGPVYSQITLCWAESKDEAVETAHRIWPNTGVPGQLSQDLRTPAHFEQAVKLVTPDLIAESMACGPDPEPLLKAAEEATAAGIDHLYFHQVGEDQEGFLGFWDEALAPALRKSG
jgi:coenzyme F420-dependent glucose-6-phosphate dehydrogenase